MKREPMHCSVHPSASGTISRVTCEQGTGLTARPGSCVQSKQCSNLREWEVYSLGLSLWQQFLSSAYKQWGFVPEVDLYLPEVLTGTF